MSLELPDTSKSSFYNDESTNAITWRPGGWGPEEGTWIWPHHPPCGTPQRAGPLVGGVTPSLKHAARSYLGPMRLATVMMSLRLAGALTFAPEPIVMATSFSVRVWQICAWKSTNWTGNGPKSHSRNTGCFTSSDSFHVWIFFGEIKRNPENFKFKQHIPELISSKYYDLAAVIPVYTDALDLIIVTTLIQCQH